MSNWNARVADALEAMAGNDPAMMYSTVNIAALAGVLVPLGRTPLQITRLHALWVFLGVNEVAEIIQSDAVDGTGNVVVLASMKPGANGGLLYPAINLSRNAAIVETAAGKYLSLKTTAATAYGWAKVSASAT